jgi:hypothetical protein
MERFIAEHLHAALSMLENLRYRFATARPLGDAAIAQFFGKQRFLTNDERRSLNDSLFAVLYGLFQTGLPVSCETVQDLKHTVTDTSMVPNLAAATIAHDLEELQKTINREMRKVVFLYVGTKESERYSQPLVGWESVIARWPQVKMNISEASLCFSLDRFGGAVFHALLVAEFGAIQLCRLLDVCGDRPGWACVTKLEAIIDKAYPVRTALEQQHSELLRDMVPKTVSLRNQRHQITHIDNANDWIVQEIGPKTADEVIFATRAFMRELAKRLP